MRYEPHLSCDDLPIDAVRASPHPTSLESVPAYVECKLVDTVEKADHSIFIGEVVDAGVNQTPAGRADDVTLTLKDLGDNVYYGG